MSDTGNLPLPKVARVPQRPEWVLLEEYFYLLPMEFGGVGIWMPAGFRSDLASVPRPLWGLIAPFELSGVGPLLHDALYRTLGVLPLDWTDGERPRFTRERADRLFLAMMKEEGVTWLRRTLAYWGCRWFGQHSWGKTELVVDLPLAEYLTADGELGDQGWNENNTYYG